MKFRVVDGEKRRYCSGCKCYKPLNLFHPNKSGKMPDNRQCDPCRERRRLYARKRKADTQHISRYSVGESSDPFRGQVAPFMDCVRFFCPSLQWFALLTRREPLRLRDR